MFQLDGPGDAYDSLETLFISDREGIDSVAGFTFNIIAKQQLVEDKTATITIVGNETGGSVTINLTVKKVAI